MSADRLQEHPLWAAARGATHPGPRGARGPTASEKDDGNTRHERLSAAAIAAELYREADGADSTINSEDEADQFDAGRKSRKRRKKEKRAKRSGSPSLRGKSAAQDDDDDDDSVVSDTGSERRKQAAQLDGLMGAAAFGRGGKDSCDLSEVGSSVSESEASSVRNGRAMRFAFPIRGNMCVGCNLRGRLGPVDAFVRDNIGTMDDDALFKTAALVYQKDILEPSEAEGAMVPAFPWKSVREHYELHSLDREIQSSKNLRSLQLLRSQLEMSMVRVEGGRREVDRSNAAWLQKTIELMRKIYADRENEGKKKK